jgi:hypothetical protein
MPKRTVVWRLRPDDSLWRTLSRSGNSRRADRTRKSGPETAPIGGGSLPLPRYLREVGGLPLKVVRGGSRKTSFTWSSLSTTTTKLS